MRELLQKILLPKRELIAGIAGTFDVENYGDLLFPIIAAAALRQRNKNIRVAPFSVNARAEAEWPFAVAPISEMIASVSAFSAMLIGGGQIIRFDKSYPIAAPAGIDLPIAYWLVPAAMAALAGKPVVWNAVGAWAGSPPAPWHDELVRQVFAASYFIGVRDTVSRDHLAKTAPAADIQLLPDTAFGLARLWPRGQESAAFLAWKKSVALEGKYIVVQASAAVAKHHAAIDAALQATGAPNAVVLPVCWCHGDRAAEMPSFATKSVMSHDWLAPNLIAEIIGGSEFVFASSLHACITALSYGVPAARAPISTDRKYELLDEFEGLAQIEDAQALTALAQRGRHVEALAVACADRLERYWDRVASIIMEPPLEHNKRAALLMMKWVAKSCGQMERLAC